MYVVYLPKFKTKPGVNRRKPRKMLHMRVDPFTKKNSIIYTISYVIKCGWEMGFSYFALLFSVSIWINPALSPSLRGSAIRQPIYMKIVGINVNNYITENEIYLEVNLKEEQKNSPDVGRCFLLIFYSLGVHLPKVGTTFFLLLVFGGRWADMPKYIEGKSTTC